MRLWSLHPKYLDAKGLVAAWREGLLARKVLQGKTKGYRSHPQLIRFRTAPNPVGALEVYLSSLWDEACARGYSFNRSKIRYRRPGKSRLPVTRGQVDYELAHLKRKLRTRDTVRYKALRGVKRAQVGPAFRIVRGKVEAWERR